MDETGVVSMVNEPKGYGFLDSDSTGERVFFHCRRVAPSLTFDEQLVGRRVRFEREQGERGPRAVNVRPLS